MVATVGMTGLTPTLIPPALIVAELAVIVQFWIVTEPTSRPPPRRAEFPEIVQLRMVKLPPEAPGPSMPPPAPAAELPDIVHRSIVVESLGHMIPPPNDVLEVT